MHALQFFFTAALQPFVWVEIVTAWYYILWIQSFHCCHINISFNCLDEHHVSTQMHSYFVISFRCWLFWTGHCLVSDSGNIMFAFSSIPHPGDMFPHCLALLPWCYISECTQLWCMLFVGARAHSQTFLILFSGVGGFSPLATSGNLNVLQIITFCSVSDFLKTKPCPSVDEAPSLSNNFLFFTQLSIHRNVCFC